MIVPCNDTDHNIKHYQHETSNYVAMVRNSINYSKMDDDINDSDTDDDENLKVNMDDILRRIIRNKKAKYPYINNESHM